MPAQETEKLIGNHRENGSTSTTKSNIVKDHPRSSSSNLICCKTKNNYQSIKNEQIEATSGSIVSPLDLFVKKPNYFIYIVTFLSAIGGFLFGYDTGIVSGAMIFIR